MDLGSWDPWPRPMALMQYKGNPWIWGPGRGPGTPFLEGSRSQIPYQPMMFWPKVVPKWVKNDPFWGSQDPSQGSDPGVPDPSSPVQVWPRPVKRGPESIIATVHSGPVPNPFWPKWPNGHFGHFGPKPFRAPPIHIAIYVDLRPL